MSAPRSFRNSRLYSLGRRFYHALNRWLDTRVLGTRWQELQWGLGIRRKVSEELFEERASHPHRRELLARVVALHPVHSVLEVGCGMGPNLFLLAELCPEALLHGMDISPDAIAVARRRLTALGAKVGSLAVGRADNLRAFANKSVDVVLLDAVLIYIGPDKIETAIGEALRVARRAVILSEWHAQRPEPSLPYTYNEGAWIYDYARLFRRAGARSVEFGAYSEGCWQDTRWLKYGRIVQVTTGPC